VILPAGRLPPVRVIGAPVVDGVPLLGAVPSPEGVADIVREQVIAPAVKSKTLTIFSNFRFTRIGDVPGFCFMDFPFGSWFPFRAVFVLATQSRNFRTKFRRSSRSRNLKVRPTRAVVNLLTVK
jgi:hypothetical protein